ncbi:MAG: hypothetical protein LBC28_05465 [Oscillospiraceae bacterium]|jgi:hypothetical protein|nr:hypothetical protein [Oscillospiraceae bacterium]
MNAIVSRIMKFLRTVVSFLLYYHLLSPLNYIPRRKIFQYKFFNAVKVLPLPRFPVGFDFFPQHIPAARLTCSYLTNTALNTAFFRSQTGAVK